MYISYMGIDARKPVFEVCEQQRQRQQRLCYVYLLIGSPQPLAHGELLWSLNVRRPSSTIASKNKETACQVHFYVGSDPDQTALTKAA